MSAYNLTLRPSLAKSDNRPAGTTGGMTMKADAATEAAVLATLNAFNEGYRERNAERLRAITAPDPDVVLIGTGADERRVGQAEIQAQAERDWSQSDAASF